MNTLAQETLPKYMRRYGTLTEEAAAELDAVVTEIQQLFKQMESVSKKDLES